MPDPSIPTNNEEMLSPRDFQRNFAPKMKALQDGDLEKIVLRRHGQMIGVVLTVEKYAELTADGQV